MAADLACKAEPRCRHISLGRSWATLKAEPLWWSAAEGVRQCQELESQFLKGGRRKALQDDWTARHCSEYTTGNRLKASRTHRLIFDVGFHSGDDTLYFLEQGHDVIAIDANPEMLREGTTRPTLREAKRLGWLQTVARGIVPSRQNHEQQLRFYVHRTVSEWSRFSEPPPNKRKDFNTILVSL